MLIFLSNKTLIKWSVWNIHEYIHQRYVNVILIKIAVTIFCYIQNWLKEHVFKICYTKFLEKIVFQCYWTYRNVWQGRRRRDTDSSARIPGIMANCAPHFIYVNTTYWTCNFLRNISYKTLVIVFVHTCISQKQITCNLH